VIAGLRFGGLPGAPLSEQYGELMTEAAPVGTEVIGGERLHLARPQPEVDLTGSAPGPCLQGVGIEAQLQHVPGLGLGPGQLGVHRFVPAGTGGGVVHADEEVGDAAHAVVHERHLEDHVVAVCERVAHPGHPVGEALGLLLARYLVDRQPPASVGRQALRLVLQALVDEQLGHRPEPTARRFQRPVLHLVAQREEVRAVEPRRDLRRGQEAITHVYPEGTRRLQAVGVPWQLVRAWSTLRGAVRSTSRRLQRSLRR
jgi:hypothetical protein